MAHVRFNIKLRGNRLSPFQCPVGNIGILLKHKVQKEYRTSDEQTILLQDYTIVPQQQLPLIQIPVLPTFNFSLDILYHALHDLGLDDKLIDFLHQCVGRKSIDLSFYGVMGFNLLAEVEVLEIEVVEYNDDIENWTKKIASRIMARKLEKRQRRRFMDVNVLKLGKNCSVCLEDFEEERLLSNKIMMPCCHLFHRSCISRWFEEQTSCPMCRREIQALDLVT